ncbi:hypothetical protein [Amycolatopsis sp. NPDC004079]|uniref:hypothetical protein n=1 Tax=Amycolatopsis sp. NPDC004079 TaxID=3154549 RepID=UPI0033A4EB98
MAITMLLPSRTVASRPVPLNPARLRATCAIGATAWSAKPSWSTADLSVIADSWLSIRFTQYELSLAYACSVSGVNRSMSAKSSTALCAQALAWVIATWSMWLMSSVLAVLMASRMALVASSIERLLPKKSLRTE